MRRRSRAGPERAKSRHRKTITQKHRALRNPSEADHKTQSDVAQLAHERDEALEREKATAEVLRVISSSPGELEPVFEAMLANATRLCEASYGAMWLGEGDGFRVAALHGALPAAFMEQLWTRAIFHPGPDVTLSRVAQNRMPIQVADLRESAQYLKGEPLPVAAADIAGIRTLLVIPMLKE